MTEFDPAWLDIDFWLATRCRDYLIEPTWEEGYECWLDQSHPGPHRAETNTQQNLIGVDQEGRPYHWVYEWTYDDEASGQT